mmetsp:Transcript_31540/g.31772  ORF Transcript_31540/g.31772 Transcript_31540/m.31772 type:complete len:82 (+) Transcript_31540:35-280(+)
MTMVGDLDAAVCRDFRVAYHFGGFALYFLGNGVGQQISLSIPRIFLTNMLLKDMSPASSPINALWSRLLSSCIHDIMPPTQ